MGGKTSKFNHSRWFGKNHRRVLCLGLHGSGKSTLTESFTSSFQRVSKPLPEIGCYKFRVDKLIVAFYDLKGDSQSRFMWRHHFEGSQGIVFVIDLSEFERVQEENRAILQELLADELLQNVPVLILCNKKDLAGEHHPDELATALGLDHAQDSRWRIFLASAIHGEGVREGLDWLLCKTSPVN